MDINDIQKIAHSHNLQEIKQIKEKYLPNLKLLFQMIDSKIIEETRKGEDSLFVDDIDFKSMLIDCNIPTNEIDNIGLNNWRQVVTHMYRKQGFETGLATIANSFSIYWNTDNSDTMDEDIDNIFGINELSVQPALDADEIDLDKPEEDILEKVDENSGGYVNMENSDEDESNSVDPAFIETSKQIHNLNEDSSDKSDE